MCKIWYNIYCSSYTSFKEEEQMKYRRLTTLRNLGWTRKEILELFDEMLEIVFKESPQVAIKGREGVVKETLEGLGLSFRNDGTKYLQDIILYYLENREMKVSLRMGVYLVIEDKWIISYEELRGSIRYAIQKAFQKPTELAKEIFEETINQKGYPEIKQFIVKTLEYVQKMLPPVEEE